MIGILEYVIGMLRILANEVEDTQDGEERIATPVTRSLVRNDRKDGGRFVKRPYGKEET